jgi:glycerol-3-phosphate O-acyltransferase 3/4
MFINQSFFLLLFFNFIQPLLVFPEGTCVNTDHIIQFKKGVFSLDDDIAICPVALKYNSVFVDAYWNSRRYSFGRHLFNLMTSWSLICDVYYLEPQYRQKDETPVEFAARVQMMIARRAHLISRNWDGYMKYWQPSARFKRAQQLAFARESFPSVFERREHEDRDNGAEFKTGESIKNNENDISTKLGIRHRVTRGGGRTPK